SAPYRVARKAAAHGWLPVGPKTAAVPCAIMTPAIASARHPSSVGKYRPLFSGALGATERGAAGSGEIAGGAVAVMSFARPVPQCAHARTRRAQHSVRDHIACVRAFARVRRGELEATDRATRRRSGR